MVSVDDHCRICAAHFLHEGLFNAPEGQLHRRRDAQQQAAMLAARLDMALNNMSHGLCMLNPGGRLF